MPPIPDLWTFVVRSILTVTKDSYNMTIKGANGENYNVTSQGQGALNTVLGAAGTASFFGLNAGNILGGWGRNNGPVEVITSDDRPVSRYEAGMMDISDSDILAENQAKNGVDDGKLKEIASLDGDGEELLPDGNEVAAVPESAESADTEASGQETAAAGIENPGEAVLTGGTGISEYIAGVQLGREQIRAKNKETLMQIINSDQISEEEKQTAIQNLIGMTEISEKENAAETLLKAKGFVDPVVSITDGKADVVVNAASLSDQERAQIEDIVKRKTEIGADGIVITLLDVDE